MLDRSLASIIPRRSAASRLLLFSPLIEAVSENSPLEYPIKKLSDPGSRDWSLLRTQFPICRAILKGDGKGGVVEAKQRSADSSCKSDTEPSPFSSPSTLQARPSSADKIRVALESLERDFCRNPSLEGDVHYSTQRNERDSRSLARPSRGR